MIAVFDSGLGGLTMAHAFRRRLPDHDLLFYGDTACGPYGHKSEKTVIRLAADSLAQLESWGARIIFLACSASVALAFDVLSEKSDAVVMEGLRPALEEALSVSRKKSIGVMGPPSALNTDLFTYGSDKPPTKRYTAACPLLIPLLENRWWKKPEANMIIKKYLHPLKVRQIDTLMLADPAYILLKRVIQRKAGRRVRLVDINEVAADHLVDYLEAHPELDQRLPRNQKTRALVTDLTSDSPRLARMYYGANIAIDRL